MSARDALFLENISSLCGIDMNEARKTQALDFFQRNVFHRLSGVRCWVAGGSVRDYFSGGMIQDDFDIFFPDRESFEKALDILKKTKGIKSGFQSPAIANFQDGWHKLQLVSSHFFSSPEDTIARFDFTVCCAAITTKDVFVNETFFEDLASRSLVINALPYPLSTMERMQKYIRKGYHICNGGLLEIAKAIKSMDWDMPSMRQFDFYGDGTPRFHRID